MVSYRVEDFITNAKFCTAKNVFAVREEIIADNFLNFYK